MSRINSDNVDYHDFTGPARREKALNTLMGMLGAANATGQPVTALAHLQHWMSEYADLAERHPFAEIFLKLIDALDDDVLEPEEAADLVWACDRLVPGKPYYNRVTSDMQNLQGVLAGILSDGQVTMQELDDLSHWMGQHENLKTVWPYDEIGSMLVEVRRDGKIDEREQAMLKRFFGEFVASETHLAFNPSTDEESMPIMGLCAVCPDIEFVSRAFCFTGTSKRAERKEIARVVVDKGGTFCNSVTRTLNYLVIGADGNPCWAYSCYGRKVEQAVNHRRAGLPVVLVHENDFWDAAGV